VAGFNSEDFIGGKVYTVKSAGCCNGPQDFVYFEESPSPFVYLDELELVNPAKDLTKRLNKVFEVMEKEGICFHVNGELYLVLKDSEEMYLVIDKECRSDVNPQFVTELPPIMEFKLRKDKP